MREVTLEELLEAGCHFGHQVTRHNPKSRDFVFEARDNIHIIDLAKTKEGLEAAGLFIKSLAAKGGSLIIVGTKRQAQAVVQESIRRVQESGADEGLFFVTSRWIGGTLTNFSEVAKNYKKLEDLARRLADAEEKAKYTKKEVGLWDKERVKLEVLYGGVKNIKKTPDALFIIDTHLEELVVKEANQMGVETVGIVDTNADPSLVDYPIPANDDAVGSIQLITSYIIDAWIEGKTQQKEISDKQKEPENKEGKEVVESKEKKEVKNGKRKPRTTKKVA